MKPLRTLVETIHGSNLHGTTVPGSDLDRKAVHLPSGEDILLQRSETVRSDAVVSKRADGSNLPDAIDHESYSLYKFARMVARGDITALEILFTPDSHIVSQDPQWPALRESAKTLLNRQAAGFVAYSVKEANRYCIKSERITAVEGLIALLDRAITEHGPDARAMRVADEVEAYAASTEHVEYAETKNRHQKIVPIVTCCDRSMHLTTRLSEIHALFVKTRARYGHRTATAQANDGYNWKSLSHAVRLGRQALELMETGSLVFPRPDAEELVAIKLGQVPFEKIEEILGDILTQVEAAQSDLPDETPDELVDAFVLEAYRTQIS